MNYEEHGQINLHTAKRFGKKSLCILLACLMMLTELPLFAIAADAGLENTPVQENIQLEEEVEPEETKVLKSVTAVVDGETYTIESENGDLDSEKIENDILFASKNRANSEPDDVDFSKYDIATIKAIIDFKRENNNRTAKTFTATDGAKETYYGASNYNTCRDDNLDLICDTCGYCLDGCTDGTLMTYTEDDIATYGEGIRHLVQASYSYDVYDDAGNFVENRTESWDYYEYDSYYADDGDGLCDKCAQPMCSNANASTSNPHSYADGICDNPLCRCCAGTHLDNLPADGKCDVCGKCTDACVDNFGGDICSVCGKCTGTCVDADEDGKCDICTKCMGHIDEKGATISYTVPVTATQPETVITTQSGTVTTTQPGTVTTTENTTSTTEIIEEIGDGKCDICDTRYCLNGHVDSDSDGICDCGLCTGTHISADGFCDECGYCMADCEVGPFGYCVNCHNKVASFFCDNHSDKLGKDYCIYCGKAYCAHMTAAEIMQEYQWFLGAYSYLTSINEDGSAPEGCTQQWLDGLKSFVTAYDEDENGDINGIHSVFNMRTEFSNGAAYDSSIIAFKDSLMNLTADNVNSSKLIGKLSTDAGTTVIDYAGSYYEQINGEKSNFADYVNTYNDCKYPASKAYFTQYTNIDSMKTDCQNKLNTLAGELLDVQLNRIFSGYNSGKVSVTDANVAEMKIYVKSVEEIFLFYLYRGDYTSATYSTTAQAVWNGSSSLSGQSDKDRRIVEFLLLDNVQYLINQRKEAVFTNFERITYDDNGNTYYAKREASPFDIARDDLQDEDDYYIYDEDMQAMLNTIDGYCTSNEFLDLLGLTNKNDIDDYDNDGIISMYDFIMYLLMDNILNDDLMNMLVESIFPAIIDFMEVKLPDMLDDSYYGITYNASKKMYKVNFTDMLKGVLKNEADWNGTWSNLFSTALVGTSYIEVYVDGKGAYSSANSNTFAKLFDNAGFSFYPYQVAARLREADATKYDGIIRKLENANKSWKVLLGDDLSGSLDFDWNIDNFDDFKTAASGILSCFGPILEVMFAQNLNVNKVIEFSKMASLYGDLNLLWGIILTFDSKLGVNIYPETINLYQDIIVPIYEGLGINDFDYGGSYNFTNINYSNTKTRYANAKEAVDKIFDPLMVLVEQTAHHPMQKVLSILPNISLYLENGLALDLLDLDVDIDATLDFDMNFSWDSIIYNCMKSIIKRIMKHWYDWLKPSKYAQWALKTATFLALQPFFKMLFETVLDEISVIDILNLAEGTVDVAGSLTSGVEGMVNGISGACDGIAGIFGGTCDFKQDWSFENPVVPLSDMIKNLNIKNLLEMFVTEDSFGVNINKLSDVVKYLVENINSVETGEQLYKIKTELIDFDELSSLGVLEKNSGSIRDSKYSSKFNSLDVGQYYYVSADTSDVFYFLVKSVFKLLGDDDSFNALLNMIGISNDTLKQTIANIKIDNLNIDEAILNDIITDGKLDLDKIRDRMDQDDLLVVLSELIVPSDKYDVTDISWKSSVKMTSESADYDTIPYLEYDNEWKENFAETAVNDVDEVANNLLTALDIDLEGYTDVASFLKNKLDTTLDGDIITQIVSSLSGLSSGMSADVLALLKKTTGLDLSQWSNDYAYLFDSATAPATRAFPLLTASVDGDGTYTWTYNGAVVTDYNDIFEALGYVISPFSKVLDAVLTGKDLKVLEYTKQAGITGSVITVKGTEGYSCAIIPLLEALGVNSDDILTQSEFNSYAGGSTAALTYSLNLLVGRLYEIINSEQPVAQLMQTVMQLLYYLSSNSFGTMLNNIAHPILTLVDIVRPIVSVDVDAILNGFIRNATYEIGGYPSADYMKQVITSRGAELSLDDISLEAVLKLMGVIVSCMKGESRVFLDLNTPVSTAMDDIAYYRQAKTSKALDKNGDAKTYYSINLSGADCFTSIISMLLEVAMCQDNAYVIDTFAKTDGLVETAIKTVYGLDVTENTDFDWAYILSDSATAEEKQNLLNTAKSRGCIAVDGYRQDEIKYFESYDKTNWDEDTADYLADYLNEIINTVLTDTQSQYANLGELLNGLVSGYMTDETVDKIIYAINDILNGENLSELKELIYWADGVLDIDLSVYEVSSSKTVGNETIYLDADGNETGLKRRTVKTASDLGQAIADILEPIDRILSWLLLGDDLQYFNTAGNVNGKNRRDDLITVTGSNGYATGLLPLLEALGCKNLKSAAEYTADGQYDIASLLSDILNSLTARVLDLVSDGDPDAAVDKIIDLLPNLFYFINSDGLTLSVNNIAASVNAMLEVYSEYSGKETTLSSITGFPIDDISIVNLFDIVKDSTGININDYITNLFSTLTIGNIYYNSNSKCDYDTYYMAYSDGEDRAEMLTIVLSVVLDLLEDPTNEATLKQLLGENAYAAAINMLNLWQFEFEMQDLSWIFTDIADTGTVVSALTMSELFGKSDYGHLWTREKAVELVNNLDSFVSDMLYLLGLSVNGVKLADFQSLMHALVGGNLYTGDIINKLLGVLQNVGSALDNYDSDRYLSGLIKNMLNIDVHAWDKYGDDYDWDFEIGDRAGFEAALTEVLKPLAPALQWLLCDDEYSFFIDADSIADSDRYNNGEQLVLYGAEGYAYGIVPIFEALKVKNIVKPADFSAQAALNADSTVSNIVSPLLDRIDELMNGTPTDLFELLPSVIYFINSNGLDTCFRDLLHALYRTFDAIEPVTGGIDLYDIIGIDFAEIDFDYIFNMLLDSINNATGFRFNTIAANAVNEITQGEVVSFTSLNGRKAYTMKYSGINDYADMLTILMRLILKFLSVDGNAEVFMHILQSKFNMAPDDYESVYALLQTLLKWAGSNTNIQVAMTSIYYIFFGVSKASDEGVKAYDLVNDKWEDVVNKLTNSDDELVNLIIGALLEAADETTAGVVDSNGIASNGLIMFFKQLVSFFKQVITFFKNIGK